MRLATRPSPPDPIAAAISGVLDDAAHSIGPAERGMHAFADGLLTAAAIGPERTFPHEWIGAIFQGHRFEDADAAQASYALLSLMQDRILRDLRRRGAKYSPGFLDQAKDGEKIGLAHEWARGFVTGMQLRGKAWEALVNSRDARLVLVPILAFLTLEDGTPVLPTNSAEGIAQMRREALDMLGPAVYGVDQYWNMYGRRGGLAPVPALLKIGRNAPCPCGSGKKYKKCCLDRAA
jgi:uncharacterized protein